MTMAQGGGRAPKAVSNIYTVLSLVALFTLGIGVGFMAYKNSELTGKEPHEVQHWFDIVKVTETRGTASRPRPATPAPAEAPAEAPAGEPATDPAPEG